MSCIILTLLFPIYSDLFFVVYSIDSSGLKGHLHVPSRITM